MQSFAEFVAESFRYEVSLNWNLTRTSLVTATFAVDWIKVMVTFEQRQDSPAWYTAFDVEQNDTTATVHSSFEIFNGVLQAATEFVGVRQRELLVFATENDRLAKIYRTYLRRESAPLETLGYQLEYSQHGDLTLRRALS
jgi:hypothetical protein